MPANTTIRLVVADDYPIYRNGLINLINQNATDYISVIGSASNGDELISEVEKKKPDIVLTDIRMPVVNGLEASRIIRKCFSSTAIIALTMFAEADIICEMFEAGAKGYLTKNADIDEVIEAVETVYNGDMHYCSSSSMNLIRKIGPSKYNRYQKNTTIYFTRKELELMKLICIQLTTKEIADKMKISTRTVEEYSYNIKQKIDAKNLVGIALYAIKNHIVSANEI